MSIHDENPRPTRKLLALDGGGIRGVLSLEVLARIEATLQTLLGRDDDFTLADYFDYVAGTSTGAIIATCLALGMRVQAIKQFYIDSGPAMFDKTNLLRRYYRNKFDDQKLAAKIRDVIAMQARGQGINLEADDTEYTLGTRALKTYLMLVLRNATTDSPWPISNNPSALYNAPARANCNLRLPLWQLVRASTAAPTYFPPEVVRFGDDQEFIFVDGGVTMYNNPAFQIFLMATLKPFALEWPTGEDKMLVVSVGTGSAPAANANLGPDDMNIIYNATSIPGALMFAAANEQDFLCRIFGKCLHGARLDREVGDMIGELYNGRFPVGPKLFSYVRYNADLSRKGLDDLGLPETIDPRNVQRMDSVDHIGDLEMVGQAVASHVQPTHFAAFVD